MQQFKLSAFLLLCLLAFAQNAHAQANLSVQGTVQTLKGTAVDDGDYDILFKLYTVESGGTPVWSETQTLEVTNGVYSVLLGAVNPLNVPFDVPYFLGTTLPGGPELIPRSPLTSSPYALSVIGQDNKFPSTGNVGIGTTAPTTTLDANGSISTATVTTSAAAYTVLAADHVVFLDLAGAQAVTLPSAATFPRREIVLINKTSTAKTVSSYVNLAGAAATAIPANGMIELRSNGTEWRLATTFAPPGAAAAKAYVYCRSVNGTGLAAGATTTLPWTEISDNTNSFSSTTFTAPRTGFYSVNGSIMAVTSSVSNTTSPTFTQVFAGGTCAMGAVYQTIGDAVMPISHLLGINFGGDIFMNAGETLFFAIYQSSSSTFITQGSTNCHLTILEQ